MTAPDPPSRPRASRLRAGRISEPGRTYFVTKCTEGRRPILADGRAAEVVVASLAHLRSRGEIALLAFVVMRDHYHVLFTLRRGGELANLMRRIGSYTSNRIRDALGLGSPIWQREGFHDHACRDDAEVLASAEYIHGNPVRQGLVARDEDWPFSGAHPSRRALLDWDAWVGNRANEGDRD